MLGQQCCDMLCFLQLFGLALSISSTFTLDGYPSGIFKNPGKRCLSKMDQTSLFPCNFDGSLFWHFILCAEVARTGS